MQGGGGGPRKATLGRKNLSFRKGGPQKAALMGVKVFISERWSWSHNSWIFKFKKFIFHKSKITKVRATWKVTYLGAKVFRFARLWP